MEHVSTAKNAPGLNPLHNGDSLRSRIFAANVVLYFVSTPSITGIVFGVVCGNSDVSAKEGLNPLHNGDSLRRAKKRFKNGQNNVSTPSITGIVFGELPTVTRGGCADRVSTPSITGIVFGESVSQGFNSSRMLAYACVCSRMLRFSPLFEAKKISSKSTCLHLAFCDIIPDESIVIKPFLIYLVVDFWIGVSQKRR